MIEDLARYLFKSLKLAGKNVISNLGQYSCFFAAIFIIQVFFATLTVILYNNDKTEWARTEDEYDYHAVIYSMDEGQMLWYDNRGYYHAGNDDIYKSLERHAHYDAYEATTSYDVYITFKGSNDEELDRAYERFRGHLNEVVKLYGNPVSYETTPLLNFERNLALNRTIYIAAMIALVVLSVFLLVILYNIRINHYKFIYGIYMSFGADFKKLFETAFWEMFVVAAITFLPATGVSILISFLILHFKGLPFVCPFWLLLLTIVYGLVVLLFSVWFPMKIMAIKPPMTLIVAQDNSNLVSSPRRSLNIFGSKFPLNYEMYTSWRFRKYNLRLLVSAVIFTSLFICGLYVAEITRVTLANDQPQYTVDLSKTSSKYSSAMRDELYAVDDAITLVSKMNSENAAKLTGHIRVAPEYTTLFANVVAPDNDDSYLATNEVQYRTLDEDIIKELERYEHDGDLSSALGHDDMVIVADAINNIHSFTYKPGDKISVAVATKRTAIDGGLSNTAILKEQISNFEFEVHEFTIAAVLYDIPTLHMPVYLSEAAFEEITGEPVKYDEISIYVNDDGLTADDTIRIESALRDWGTKYGGVKVTNTHAHYMSTVNEDKQYDEIFTLVAALLLTISPMIWFFSQTLYYLKRENEFTILQSMGALETDIKRLYIFGGIFMGALAFVFCMALGYSLSYLLFWFVNSVVPYWTQQYVRYHFYMPWQAIVLSVAMSVACGFLSAFLPYRSFLRRRSQTLSVEYGEVSE